jgi:hypothetical protein
VKVLIVYPADQKSVYHELKNLLLKLDIKVFPYEAAKTAEGGTAGVDLSLCRKLLQSTHTILVLSGTIEKAQWFTFVAGFSLGRKETSLVYIQNKHIVVPEYLKSFLWMSSLEMIEKHFDRESHRYHYQKEIQEAKMRLVEEGIPVSTRGFFEVITEGDREGAENFLLAGFSPNLKNEKGVSLLAEAVRNGHEEIMNMLIDFGADVNEKSADNGNTPLMDAATKGHEDMLSTLIAAGADLDVQSKNGQTALILTVGQGSYPMTERLLKAGADPTVSDKLGMTARKYAELFKHKTIIEALAQALSS